MQWEAIEVVKEKILRGVNDILHIIDKQYYAPNMKVDFSKPEKSNRLNGFYLEDGIRGMLEAKDFQRLEMVFPFAAAFIDRMCDDTEQHPITDICVLYSDVVAQVFQYEQPKLWTKGMVKQLEKSVEELQTKMIMYLSEFHNSNLRTLKFHMLQHLSEDILRYGGPA